MDGAQSDLLNTIHNYEAQYKSSEHNMSLDEQIKARARADARCELTAPRKAPPTVPVYKDGSHFGL